MDSSKLKKNDNYESIQSVNPLYPTINGVNRFIKEKNENKYFVFDFKDDEGKEVLIIFAELWNGIKNKIDIISGGKKDLIEIKFNSDDSFPVNEVLKLHVLTIVVRSVFEEDGKLYPQIF